MITNTFCVKHYFCIRHSVFCVNCGRVLCVHFSRLLRTSPKTESPCVSVFCIRDQDLRQLHEKKTQF
ncbi:Hypothetical protein CINCED_3A017982 [Cinara cedri]|uniref:Uncharacterized protein n=1 Tax=Cinara cedri TaxID=506608 RepID=A0A5E4N7A4_9HEMI|nr:Hypothetical protein CINCED_3A017982 [Cinara cedri]